MRPTAALDARGFESYHDSYATEQRVLRHATGDGLTIDRSDFTYLAGYDPTDLPAGIKPYLPGLLAPTWSGIVADQDSPYQLDKIAGVDALGLLLGAIAMAPERSGDANGSTGEPVSLFRGVLNAANRAVAVELDEYFRIETGLPFAPATSASVAGADYRLARSDLERMTTIVPSIADVRAGDVIVRYDTAGSPHIGIVVETRWDTPPTPRARAADHWNDVVVVSVRRGFRMVTLGTWGNPAGTFGGFTAEPEAYHIRRLLVAPDGVQATEHYEAEEWEVRSLRRTIRSYTDYAFAQNVPLNSTTKLSIPSNDPNLTAEENAQITAEWSTTQFEYTRLEQIKNHRFYRELPPTSYPENLVYNSVLVGQNPMVVTNYTGWRDLSTSIGYRTGYHRGFDVGAPENTPILAPEDGVFWIEDLPSEENGGLHLRLPNDDFLILEPYMSDFYGDVTILVTNADRPREGRVYLFAHQDYDEDMGEGRQFDPPIGRSAAIAVETGEQIGISDDKGSPGSFHVHIEVYEFFPDFDFSEMPPLTAPMIRDGAVTQHYGWQRVDPRTILHPSILVDSMRLHPDATQHLLDSSAGRQLFPRVDNRWIRYFPTLDAI